MAITKMMHMKASSKARIDIHLEHSINYILQPKKLGEANLAGGINCLPEMAYTQMKATKQMFGKLGGRQGYHFVISLKPGEGTPAIMYDIAMRFAKEAFHGEYEVVVAVHTDRNHLHAHIVINSVNMVTGYKFQCHNGDWKYRFQPITNKLCEEYGLHITPAEYSQEPKNMARPQWEREQVFSKWIEQDARLCAVNAESMEHFIFLLEKAGFEVKQEKHIAVKVPGMKRFKRLDTISDDFSRENLEALFKYGEPELIVPIAHTTSLPVARKACLSPYQKKCYTRMYRLRLAEKKRFSYGAAYLYEQIQKMNELQEEYLVVVKYDVRSFADLYRLKQRLQHADEELCKTQKEMYRDRAVWKRSCKTEEEVSAFEASEDDYRERLEQLKLQKKDIRDKLKAVIRCLERDGSLKEAELELRIPVDELDDITEMYKVEVPENPYRVQKAETTADSVVETDMEETCKGEDVAEAVSENVMAECLDASGIELLEGPVNEPADIVETREDAPFGELDTATSDTDKKDELPSDKNDYMRLSVAEKVRCYGCDMNDIENVFNVVKSYFESVGMNAGFDEIYEEAKLLADYYAREEAENLISRKVEQILQRMDVWDVNPEQLIRYPVYVLSEVFDLTDMDYYTGIKVFGAVLDRKGVHLGQQEKYELFEKIYEEGMREKKQDNVKGGR